MIETDKALLQLGLDDYSQILTSTLELFLGHKPVIWVTTKNFEQKLFVSQAHEEYFGHKIQDFYNNPKSMLDFVIDSPIPKGKAWAPYRTSVYRTMNYTMRSKDGTPVDVMDTCFDLFDNQQNVIGHSGILVLRHENETINIENNKKILNLQEVFQEKLKIKMEVPDEIEIVEAFSKRELEVGKLLIQGYSSKMIAKVLNLSHRTIEFYLLNMRKKTHSRNSAELAWHIKFVTQ